MQLAEEELRQYLEALASYKIAHLVISIGPNAVSCICKAIEAETTHEHFRAGSWLETLMIMQQ